LDCVSILRGEPTEFDPVDRTSPYLRNIVLKYENMMMDVIKVSKCIHMLQSVFLARDYTVKTTNAKYNDVRFAVLILICYRVFIFSSQRFIKCFKRTAGYDLMYFRNHLSQISYQRPTILIGTFSWVFPNSKLYNNAFSHVSTTFSEINPIDLRGYLAALVRIRKISASSHASRIRLFGVILS
jgi:hypothetical protein